MSISREGGRNKGETLIIERTVVAEVELLNIALPLRNMNRTVGEWDEGNKVRQWRTVCNTY